MHSANQRDNGSSSVVSCIKTNMDIFSAHLQANGGNTTQRFTTNAYNVSCSSTEVLSSFVPLELLVTPLKLLIFESTTYELLHDIPFLQITKKVLISSRCIRLFYVKERQELEGRQAAAAAVTIRGCDGDFIFTLEKRLKVVAHHLQQQTATELEIENSHVSSNCSFSGSDGEYDGAMNTPSQSNARGDGTTACGKLVFFRDQVEDDAAAVPQKERHENDEPTGQITSLFTVEGSSAQPTALSVPLFANSTTSNAGRRQSTSIRPPPLHATNAVFSASHSSALLGQGTSVLLSNTKGSGTNKPGSSNDVSSASGVMQLLSLGMASIATPLIAKPNLSNNAEVDNDHPNKGDDGVLPPLQPLPSGTMSSVADTEEESRMAHQEQQDNEQDVDTEKSTAAEREREHILADYISGTAIDHAVNLAAHYSIAEKAFIESEEVKIQEEAATRNLFREAAAEVPLEEAVRAAMQQELVREGAFWGTDTANVLLSNIASSSLHVIKLIGNDSGGEERDDSSAPLWAAPDPSVFVLGSPKVPLQPFLEALSPLDGVLSTSRTGLMKANSSPLHTLHFSGLHTVNDTFVVELVKILLRFGETQYSQLQTVVLEDCEFVTDTAAVELLRAVKSLRSLQYVLVRGRTRMTATGFEALQRACAVSVALNSQLS